MEVAWLEITTEASIPNSAWLLQYIANIHTKLFLTRQPQFNIRSITQQNLIGKLTGGSEVLPA